MNSSFRSTISNKFYMQVNIMKFFFMFLLTLCSLNMFSQTADEYYFKGSNKFDNKDYKGSIADYTKAIELKPDFGEAYIFRGAAKFRLEDYRGAIVDFTKAIEFKPNEAFIYYNRGLSNERLNKLEDSKIDFVKKYSS